MVFISIRPTQQIRPVTNVGAQIACGVLARHVPGCGVAAFATKEFQPGDVVLLDDPREIYEHLIWLVVWNQQIGDLMGFHRDLYITIINGGDI